MSRAEHQWTQFRRLLLGTVLEVLLEQGAALDATTLSIAFDPRSRFQVPRFDNYMRFSGSFQADVLAPLEPAESPELHRLRQEESAAQQKAPRPLSGNDAGER